MSAPFIPPATLAKLNTAHPKGTRHEAKKDIAMSLLGNGIPAAAVIATLREKFPEARDSEIEGVVQWAESKNPTPSGFGQRPGARPDPAPTQRAATPTRTPSGHCAWWMGDTRETETETLARSPIAFNGTPAEELATFLEVLYAPDERLNIVCAHTVTGEKANPCGAGKTLSRDEWCSWILKKGIPQAEAGAWFRPNPCGDGTGKGGAIRDEDVIAFRFLLLECDNIPIETQLALYSRLELPIAAIINSGGKSAHAWLRLDCATMDEYDATARRVMDALKPFGIDQGNKNASRLSRLPNAKRGIGARGDGIQQLLYIDSSPQKFDAETESKFLKRIAAPLVDGKPMRALMREAVDRFEELYNNRGKMGVQVGLAEFDKDTGGFKGGQMTVIAAGTNCGKSTVAINLINGALQNRHGVALFTLEMDREEIVDLLIANNCRVNRNCFNTGFFDKDRDFVKIANESSRIANYPLWIFDEASMTVEDIRGHVMALKAENRIGMVVVDYVQIVTHPDARLPREQQVAEIARSIRILAKQSKLPFVVLSQLNDEGKLRESRVVAHEAHNVIVLEPNEEQTEIEMRVIKGRRIMKKDYTLMYQPEFARVSMPKIDPADFPEAN